MNFGETLKKLRKQKDMTQEQLAEYLNISTQAVSRWETGISLPDITLLPALANIFDVSTDILLGVDIANKEKRVQEILSEAWEYFTIGNEEKEMAILRAGLKEFPNDFRIMNKFLYKGDLVDSSEKIKIGEKILAECTRDDIRHNAIRALCWEYPKVGEIEKAKELARRTPFITECYEFIMEFIGTEQEKAHQSRDNIFMLMDFMVQNIARLNSPPEDFDNPYTLQEKITLSKKIIVIIECLIEDENYGLLIDKAAWAYLDIGRFYTELKDYDNALENLSRAVEYVIMIDRECDPLGDKYDPDREYTSLLLRGMKYSHINCTMSMSENYSMLMLNRLNEDCFDQIRNRPEFMALKEQLQTFAKSR